MADFFTRQQLFTERASFSQAQINNRARWALRANMARGGGSSAIDALVQVDPNFHRTIAALVERVAPTVAAAYNQHLGKVASKAFDKWPVKTGLSKSLLSLEYEVAPDGSTLTGSLRSLAPYSLFIDRSRLARNLIWNAGDRAAAAMAETIADGISE